ncbi:hypothetical protein [Amycolatopsis sacchari]|uniref:Uncharacterized protein n=1 Tax=Amycolatopsis sacchari TaxID=115433 RepID=A0A1I3UK48_9PSEU|nr:hypothetical protein [Amycolatopsis sacchari]SFJ83884.1 hypothetical protein SAMN05421835_109128 [Amycolatopsis sacchari]
MRTILTAAGIEVTRADPGEGPHALLVTRRLAPSPWLARRDAEFDARYEKKRVAWAKRDAGFFIARGAP